MSLKRWIIKQIMRSENVPVITFRFRFIRFHVYLLTLLTLLTFSVTHWYLAAESLATVNTLLWSGSMVFGNLQQQPQEFREQKKNVLIVLRRRKWFFNAQLMTSMTSNIHRVRIRKDGSMSNLHFVHSRSFSWHPLKCKQVQKIRLECLCVISII